MIKIIFLLLTLAFTLNGTAQNSSELFDKSKMEYKGSKLQQAKLLLRNVEMWGRIVNKEPVIDSQFQNLLNSKLDIEKQQLRLFLNAKSITDAEVGGSIENSISHVILNDAKVFARYFVIHDVSTPAYPKNFPNDINESSWVRNSLSSWNWQKGKEPAHCIVTRTGKSKTLNDFGVGWRATKFEKNLGVSSRGLFIHIELVQPRVYPPGNEVSAPVAPVPGFTKLQYQRLALLYICASVRKGEWLIPAFHVNIDEGLKDGHDDPQNFKLNEFTDEIIALISMIKQQ